MAQPFHRSAACRWSLLNSAEYLATRRLWPRRDEPTLGRPTRRWARLWGLLDLIGRRCARKGDDHKQQRAQCVAEEGDLNAAHVIGVEAGPEGPGAPDPVREQRESKLALYRHRRPGWDDQRHGDRPRRPPPACATQDPGKVAVSTKCPNMPAAGSWLPAWTKAVAWRRAMTWDHRTNKTNRDFAGVLAQARSYAAFARAKCWWVGPQIPCRRPPDFRMVCASQAARLHHLYVTRRIAAGHARAIVAFCTHRNA
jgi:hypothetical protein